MKVLFLGTSSGKPSNHRNVTSIAVIMENGEFSLVDCGEATQHQIMKSELKITKLREIYITHLHGDHIFGLLGLLCTLNEVRKDPLKIYGPKGLKEFLRFIKNSITNYELDINEYAENWEHSTISRVFSGNYEFVVQFAVVKHTVTAFAYKITRVRVVKQIDMKRFFPHMDYHRNELDELGFNPPHKIIDTLKNNIAVTMKSGFVFDFENYYIKENDVSLIIALDNYNTDKMVWYFESCDVLIHECTYACYPEMTETEVNEITALAINHGHSTNRMASKVAKKLKARQLLLTHFSNRYEFEDEERIIQDITGDQDAGMGMEIISARDFTQVCICSK
jgi:ribonuclease Z